MKKRVFELIDRVARRALTRRHGDSFDVLEIAFLKAAYESAEYYETYLISSPSYGSDLELLQAGLALAPREGLLLEFGVASGRTINHLALQRPSSTFFGFDSFEGLPEAWRSGFGKGTFAQPLPQVPPNVSLIKGLFNETIPKFLEQNDGKVSFLHIDCDLYSSTKSVLSLLAERIQPGSVIVFDEYWNYPGWKHHEFKAFEEFKSALDFQAKPIGFVSSHQQVGFILQ